MAKSLTYWRVVAGLILFAAATACSAQDRETKVRNDRKNVGADPHWIYNDLPKGIAEAKKTGKPLLVVFRCIPCESCAQLDAQVVKWDSAARDLMDEFVCVRIVQANGIDLSLFNFDYDQSFAAFLMNADKTIYGRFGTRSHQAESDQDVSIEGFARALEGALELHKKFSANKSTLAAKRGSKSEFPVPEKFPSIRGRYNSKLDYEGKVVKSCIHCHQLGEAKRLVYRSKGKPIPDKVLYPWPMPNVLVLTMDPKQKATVKSVADDSTAGKDGFRAGDEILLLNGQPLLSIVDIQWLLHNAGESGAFKAEVKRGGKTVNLPLTLEKGWRRRGTISWRATSWDLLRMATGGLVLEELPGKDWKRSELPKEKLALRVKYVGQYGAHAAGKRAGFRKGGVIVSIDGKTGRMSESGLLAYLINGKRAGEKVAFNVLREGRTLTLKLPMQ